MQQGALPTANPSTPETRPGLVTPHASALALISPLAAEAITNLQTLKDTFPNSYDSTDGFGFYDSIMLKRDDPQHGVASERFSALAQEWLFLAIANAKTRFIHSYFYRNVAVQQAHEEMYPN